MGGAHAPQALEQARSRTDAEFEIVDIAHYKLPLLDEPMPHEHVQLPGVYVDRVVTVPA